MRLGLILIVLLSVCVMGCGSVSTAEKKPEPTSATPPNNSNANANPPTVIAVNTNVTIPANKTQAANANVMAKAKPLTYPAADDSEYATMMNSSGFPVETRTFRTDKYISKVVRTWQDADKKSITIYLKSGKVVPVAGDRWPDIKQPPVSVFYEAVGIKPAENASTPPKRKPE